MKPLSQVLSHLPQLYVTYERKSTQGVSLLSQHLNLIGGFLGLYQIYVIPPVSKSTYLVYLNSIFQATSIYAFAIYFDGFQRFFDEREEKQEEKEEDKEINI